MWQVVLPGLNPALHVITHVIKHAYIQSNLDCSCPDDSFAPETENGRRKGDE